MFTRIVSLFLFGCVIPQLGFSQELDKGRSIQAPSQSPYRIFQLDKGASRAWVKFKGDFLYWRPYSDGMDYAYVYYNKRVDNGAGTNVIFKDDQEVKNVSLEWNAGFRIQGAVFLPEIFFDTSVTWTRLTSSGYNKITEDIFQSGFGVRERAVERIWLLEEGLDVTEVVVDELEGSLDLKLNFLDWELGKSFSILNYLLLRPFAGIRSLWADQKFVVSSFIPNPPFTIPGFFRTDIEMKNDYWGIGPRIGLNGKWRFFDFYAFRFIASSSLFFGRFKIRQSEELLIGSITYNVKNSRNLRAVKTSHQLGAGMEFGYTFSNDTRLEISLDYELNYLQNQNQLTRYYNLEGPLGQPGDLSVHGFTLGGALFF